MTVLSELSKIRKRLSASNANLNLWPQKRGIEHHGDDYSNYFMEVHQVLHCVRSSHRRCSVRKGLRPATLLKKRLSCFPVNFAKFLRIPSLQNTSGRLLLFCDFIFHTFSIIDFISPTIKDHYMKCSKCFREGISWIYYQFAVRTVVKNLPLGL